MALRCCICGDDYRPWGRWKEDTCPPCWERNFAASQEWTVREAEAPVVTPRQMAAMRRIAARWAQEAEDNTRG